MRRGIARIRDGTARVADAAENKSHRPQGLVTIRPIEFFDQPRNRRLADCDQFVDRGCPVILPFSNAIARSIFSAASMRCSCVAGGWARSTFKPSSIGFDLASRSSTSRFRSAAGILLASE